MHPFTHSYIIKKKALSICVYCRNISIYKSLRMNPARKNTFIFKYKEPKIDNLKELSSKVTPPKHNKFQDVYGSILELLTEKVDLGAIITLDQYYDTPLRCFSFSDLRRLWAEL